MPGKDAMTKLHPRPGFCFDFNLKSASLISIDKTGFSSLVFSWDQVFLRSLVQVRKQH